MRLVLLGGFLGAGKTTTMLAAGRALEAAGERVAVVTNDQGVDLVDSRLARAAGLAGADEVTGGCFCCRFEDLATVLARLRADTRPDVVLAEAVGSCTDLQSTVVAPLLRFHPGLAVAPLTVLVDPLRYAVLSRLWRPGAAEPELSYLYRHQLDEADLVVVNKTDLLAPAQLAAVTADVAARFPHAAVLELSASTGAGLDALVARWSGGGEHRRGSAVDYDRYARAEAELAWTNQTFRLRATAGEFAPVDWATAVLREFARRAGADTEIGHVKVHLSTPDGATAASLTAAGAAPSVTAAQERPASAAEATLNARVRTDPAVLATLVDACVRAADARCGTRSHRGRGDVFRPAYPVPVHRL